MTRDTPTLYLVRHGEVANPDHLVYAALPGFTLSDLGTRQAEAAAAYLADRPVALVLSSPLERAVATAAPIAAVHGLPVETDDRLAEWGLGDRWAGNRWESLPEVFPGELEAYLAEPSVLDFAPESLADLATRVAAAVTEAWKRTHPIGDGPEVGDIVVVSHQDPIEAARRRLTGRPAPDFHTGKPGHAAVVALVPRPGPESGVWDEARHWEPDLPTG
jgi:broad specificity phosphatase PhoE